MKYVLIVALCSLAIIACRGSSENEKKGKFTDSARRKREYPNFACANGIAHGTTFDDISHGRTYLCVDGENYVIGCIAQETGRIALGGTARSNGWLYRCEKETNGTATLTKGIPDYRSERVGQYARTPHRPITIQEFMTSEWWRRRFWARNYVAWPRFRNAPCNETHYKLADWERSERFHWLITQNVDGLHSLAGSQKVTELHGCGRAVVCMDCGEKYSRDDVQTWITELNPDWTVTEIGELAPDGDVPISEQALHSFKVPYCRKCGPNSIVKTDVVFFGDNVSRNVVDRCHEMVEQCSGVLVLGSSLTVMSGYRFVYQAHLRGLPIMIVNIGPTRADELATVKVSAKCSEVVKNL